ncbi:hepatitis A virus cellular receptor 1-like [Myotis lucifugus]|uniref:hepatitis A virus cellular receptor 1-like n=1 Tax=Myotis lucifugus TaxID=59463 RepID=UPI000CCC4ACB|nr:hepatitis A virus cellular receptor 1-like [Myotis lucifugus]
MPSWVAFPSLILLWADVVVSQTRVTGVVGQSVTLPCTYSTAGEIAPMCWGRGPCPLSKCSNTLVSTDGYHVTYEKDKRFRMNGIISRGDVSLTIQNAALSDTGTYCCRIEYSGVFNDYKGNIFLEIKPAPTTVPTPPKVFSSAPTTPGTTKNVMTAPTTAPTPPKVFSSAPTTPRTTKNLKTAPPKVTSVPTPPKVFTSAPTTPAPTLNHKTETTSSSPVQTTETPPITPQETSTTSSLLNSSRPTDGNSTVTQPSDSGWQYNETDTILKQNTQENTSKLYIGLCIAAMILLTILAAILTQKYLCGKRMVLQISKEPQTGTSQNGTAVRYQAQENIYFENSLYNVPEDPA